MTLTIKMQEERLAGKVEGKMEAFYELVGAGRLGVREAAEFAQVPENEFQAGYKDFLEKERKPS